jgi:phosphoribosyl-ATP pyrophosphohydrolase/phosphoribosyl-AMP cyclohydrolase/histidinol dehydrogenase
MNDIRANGEPAMLRHAVRLGDLEEGKPHIYRKADLKRYFDELPAEQQGVLQRTAARIRLFAQAQLDSVAPDAVVDVPGGKAGQFIAPVEVAGCYAPGGRYPLPSSVLMGVVTAR